MISVRPYDPEADYPTFEQWWKAHHFTPVPPIALPALGNVALYNNAPVAAAWLFMDSTTPIAMLEWIVTNPDNNPKISAIGITHCVQSLKLAAAAAGHTIILASCRQESLARLLIKTGFQESDKNVIHLINVLTEN